jgi:hypothetical protein
VPPERASALPLPLHGTLYAESFAKTWIHWCGADKIYQVALELLRWTSTAVALSGFAFD